LEELIEENKRTYPRRLIRDLYKKYILENRIPKASSIEGKKRWVVATVIKKDVRDITKWHQANIGLFKGVKPEMISKKLLELYMDACKVLDENPNEQSWYFNSLHSIVNPNNER
jgi:hypothetical protein